VPWSQGGVFKKTEESSQHLKLLYIQGHLDGRPISRMLIDGGAAINLISYTVFKKVGREDDKLMKTNLTLNGVGGGEPNGGQRRHLHGAYRREQVASYCILRVPSTLH
jgi:hypothetical protein